MDAIRKIDFQFRFVAVFEHHFIDGRRAKILAGVSVFANAAVGADTGIEHDQVAGLIFFVARAGMVDVGETVEGELAVALESAED